MNPELVPKDMTGMAPTAVKMPHQDVERMPEFKVTMVTLLLVLPLC